jgi:hypothetical protein
MKSLGLTGCLLMLATIVCAFSGTGCNKSDKKGDPQVKAKLDPKSEKGDAKSESTHSGWWCSEHGVPEEICSICMSEASAKKKFKDNGDWCPIHDRAQSQCFKCDPSKYKKFEAMYVAKYNTKPEPPPKEEFEK